MSNVVGAETEKPNQLINEESERKRVMKKELKPALAFACAVAILAGVQTQAQAQETIKTRIGDLSFTHDFANGYPTNATQKLLFDEIDFQRACQAYLWSIPLVRATV